MIKEKNCFDELMLKYSFALQTLETELNILIKEFEYKNRYNPVEHIKSRIKTEKSATDKLIRKGFEVNSKNLIEQINDMIGIRVVCSFISDVYDIVNLVKNSTQFRIIEERDYIKNPKDSGYISYHMIVLVPVYLNNSVEYMKAEIQIRTIAMDFWASLDHKISYKFPTEIPEEVKDEMYNCALDIQALDEKMLQINSIVNKYNQD